MWSYAPVKRMLSLLLFVILHFLSIQCYEVEEQTINIVFELEFVLTEVSLLPVTDGCKRAA